MFSESQPWILFSLDFRKWHAKYPDFASFFVIWFEEKGIKSAGLLPFCIGMLFQGKATAKCLKKKHSSFFAVSANAELIMVFK